jgi:hypothetical protein
MYDFLRNTGFDDEAPDHWDNNGEERVKTSSDIRAR